MSSVETPRNKLIKELRFMLGDGMIEVELDPEHYNTAIDLALDRFKQRSDMSTEESYIFFKLQPDQQEYQLPAEVQDVRKLYRRGVGSNTAGGMNFDPFEAAFSNIYLLQAGRTGGLATWDFFAQYQETMARVFASEISFTWNRTSQTLKIHKNIRGEEDVLIHVFNAKPEIALLTDVYSRPWLRDYSLAQCKMMLGQARSKFASGFAGPGTSVVLNGEQLKQEAAVELERLEVEMQNFVTGKHGMPFIIG